MVLPKPIRCTRKVRTAYTEKQFPAASHHYTSYESQLEGGSEKMMYCVSYIPSPEKPIFEILVPASHNRGLLYQGHWKSTSLIPVGN